MLALLICVPRRARTASGTLWSLRNIQRLNGGDRPGSIGQVKLGGETCQEGCSVS